MDNKLWRIASLTWRLNKAEKSLAIKQEQHHDVCVELVRYEQELSRIRQENLDLRVEAALIAP
jgi:hypothetical protein